MTPVLLCEMCIILLLLLLTIKCANVALVNPRLTIKCANVALVNPRLTKMCNILLNFVVCVSVYVYECVC